MSAAASASSAGLLENGTALRRQPLRGARLAEQIVATAARLLDRDGEGFTIQELVSEAGVALQTLYRHFSSKDHLLLEVLASSIRSGCAQLQDGTVGVDDPIERLHIYVVGPLLGLSDAATVGHARIVTSEHFRLFQLFPAEVDHATRPFTLLVKAAVEDANERGLLRCDDVEADAVVITRLVMTAFHHYAYADSRQVKRAADDLWSFCLRALGGSVRQPSRRRRRR